MIGRAGIAIIVLVALVAVPAVACTIGVASGQVTHDGRPLIWKVRDNAAVPDNEVYFNDSLTIPFVAVVTAPGLPETATWMGVNRAGFALVNSNVSGLGTRANGEFMRQSLGQCRSVRQFLDRLEMTAGLRDVHANFAVLDSTGAAMIIEASRDSHWTYDAADPQGPGYIVRANFAAVDTVGVGIDGLAGEERFVRSGDLVQGWIDAGELSLASLAGRHARDFSNWACQPFPVPCFACGEPDSFPGWFDSFFSISSGHTVSAGVIHGVLPGEAAWLSTLWAHLGQPACTVALPYWPVGPTPAVADGPETAPLCDVARQIENLVVFHRPWYPRMVDSFALDDGEGGGLWNGLLPYEAAVQVEVEGRMVGWRQAPPAWPTLLALEDSLATAAHGWLVPVLVGAPSPVSGPGLRAAPNPFNPATVLSFTLPEGAVVRLEVFDVAGRRVVELFNCWQPAGRHEITWKPDRIASGVYFARLATPWGTEFGRLALIR